MVYEVICVAGRKECLSVAGESCVSWGEGSHIHRNHSQSFIKRKERERGSVCSQSAGLERLDEHTSVWSSSIMTWQRISVSSSV